MTAWTGDTERISWGTAARMDRTEDRLLGREREEHEILGRLTDPDGPRLLLVRGERGVGRTTFVQAVGDRLREQGTAVLAMECAPADGERPLLLALRLVMALEEHRPAAERRWPAGQPVARALSAVDRRDGPAMDALLRAALAQSGPVAVLVDDAQHADTASLAVLRGIHFTRLAPGVRLVVSAARHAGGAKDGRHRAPDRAGSTPGPDRTPGRDGPRDAVERLRGAEGAHSMVLSRLSPEDVTALVAQRLRATPDATLALRIDECTRGVPGAVDAILTGWERKGEIRITDGHAFVGTRAPLPVLPDDDRFVRALDALGEPCRTVAAALSVLWPFGLAALQLIAAWTGLSPGAVGDGVRDLVGAGIVDGLPGPDGTAVQGWTFRLPLMAHTVAGRLRPLERSRLSAIAVEALWANADAADAGAADAGQPVRPAALLLDEARARTYLADRIADAGTLVDRERAVTELTAAAERVRPGTEDWATLRWLRAAAQLIEHPAARAPALQRWARAAYVAGDYRTGRAVAERLLRNPGHTLSPSDLQAIAQLLVGVTVNELDWRTLSRLTTAQWWDELPVPALAKVSGRALALCHLARWQEAWDLLSRTEAMWNTSPRCRATPRAFRAAAARAMGRPEAYLRELALPDAPALPVGQVYALAGAMFDEMIVGYDRNAAQTLLKSRGMTVEMLPPLSRFLWSHLTGRWDEALESGRRLLATDDVQLPASDSFLLPARTAAILLARGRTSSALRVLESVPGIQEAPPSCSLTATEAEVLGTLGDLDGAERALRRGLDRAQEHGQVQGTDELWAPLAEVTAGAGRTAEAVTCLERLGRIAARSGSERTRLLHLLASARVLRSDSPDIARANLRRAVDLARARGLPWETATTLAAAADAGAGPATLLHEAYELFGTTGATLWRFHTRTAMRQAGLTVAGRKQATAENEHLLAVLIAEGLTNRQIATVLRLSEDAVANRLSRLFTRTGMRSRTEVVAAVLTGSL
ncbi:AAA family ATPase [Streptomyces sp. NBC_01092]|uniref:AAA family ATPase n=1 Tax=Streptomyces sp. NBC_01092 TaxID=2903748 RepID=UPI0038663F8A|nr:AAA family ATPase [Streptomyces sp. NBC_01092]